MLRIYIIVIIFTLSNCASETAKMAHQINNDKENVFNAKQFHWANYQVYGARFLTGIRYNFDLNF